MLHNNRFLVLMVLLFSGILLSAQDADNVTMDQQKAWMEYMNPGWAHTMLADHVGEWNYVSKFWMYPGAEAQVSEGTAVNEMILGGRYLRSVNKGTAWGMPMEGISVEGFDNKKEIFQNTWIDNMGSGISISTGTYDKEKNAIVYNGSMVDPFTGNELVYKQIHNFGEKDRYSLEMYMNHEGQEFKAMEIICTRK